MPASGAVPRDAFDPSHGTVLVTGRLLVDGYWAEVKVRSPDAGGEWYLSGAWLNTPEEAVAWLHGEADRLASVLEATDGDPAEEDGGYTYPVSQVFRDWAADLEFRAVQCAALAGGQPVSANARGADRIWGAEDVEVFYSLSARPLLRPALDR